MTTGSARLFRTRALLVVVLMACAAVALPLQAQKPAPAQKMDEAYTKLIKEYTQDPRISTELVDHMPASDKVPSPLKFFGRIPGTPGELTYAKDIQRYYEALAKASPRFKYWTIGKTEEGRDMVVLAVADEATIKTLDKYKADLNALTDPRKTTEAQARQIIKTSKPIYWVTAGMHSGETGGPEMLIELPYRLAVEETPFIQNIRNNVIVFITPVLEVDGKEKHVDTYYYGKKTGKPRPPLVYWGKYVAHDNNRDAMGQMLKLTQNVNRTFLEWKPTILHDLHEASNYLYASTGTGPYNEALDAITINEWWALANAEVTEMAKRNVPGVWTYGFYDGWVPNYMFFVAHAKNAVGRFYEVQNYGPDIVENLRMGANATSREWYRPNPPLPSIKWGPRNNTNIQQSALLIALNYVARNRDTFLENYWIKNQRAVNRGRNEAPYAWVIPAAQRRKGEAAELVNALRRQGLEISQATSAFKAGTVDVAAGDYVIRADQPYRTMADMYFSLQNYAPANPRPYDDTGWTMQLMRNVKLAAGGRQGRAGAADDARRGRRQGARRHRGHGPGGRRRAHKRQQHRDVPLQARRREDAGGGRGLHARRARVPRRGVHHPERRPREAGADAERARAVGLGGGGGTGREDARPRRAAHRLRALVVEHAERRVGEGRPRQLRRALHLLRRHQASRGQPAREVRA